MSNREYKYIGELADGYEYKIASIEGTIKIIGVATEKKPIVYLIDSEGKLIQIEV